MSQDQIIRRFRRAVAALNSAMLDLQRDHPEACYYLANDQLHLMIGPDHTGRGEAHPENSIDQRRLRSSGGGDW